jgi:DNA-binding HxlR family transcriptional regulator
VSAKKVKPSKDDVEPSAKKEEKAERLAELIKLISDDKSLLIFKTFLLASHDTSEILRTRFKLTRKQYYSRLSHLTKAGLVKKQKGRYFVTAFGKVIYDAHRLLGTAVKNHWKLKAIDSLGVAHDGGNMPEEERIKIIGLMIDNQQIKRILLSPEF